MAATDYVFSIADDTLYGNVAKGSLCGAIELFPVLAGAIVVIDDGAGTITVTTPEELDTQIGLPVLQSIVAAHDGVDILRTVIHTRKLVGLEVAIVASPQIVDGFCVGPDLLSTTPERLVFRISGQCKGTGAGATLQLIEDTDGDDEDKLATAFPIPDSSGAWQMFSADSDVVLRVGTLPNCYRLEGSLNAATSAALRFCSIAPIWV